MAETNDTIDGLLAEMRDEAARADMEQGYSLDDAAEMMREFAWRFDAAHKREVQAATTENSSAVGNAAREMRYLASRLLREWQDAVGSNPKFSRYGCMVRRYEKEFDELVREFGKEQLTAIGNAAKLREALETLRELLGDLLRLGDAEYHDDFSNFCDIIDAALAAPPRNCDVYNNESCRMAYHLHGDGLMTMQAFADWLFAPATEKEGGNNANK